jgi:hypothetical protein
MMAALVFNDSAIRTFNNSRELEIEYRVHFANLKLALWGLDFGFASEFMGEGSGALLEVWGTPLGPFSESFEFKKKTIGSNIDPDVDLRCWGKSRCVAIGSWWIGF